MKYHKPVLDDSNVKVCIQDSQEIVHTVKHFLDFDMPASILDIQSACMYSLHLTVNEIPALEYKTRDQSSSQEWYSARKYK